MPIIVNIVKHLTQNVIEGNTKYKIHFFLCFKELGIKGVDE